MYVRVHACSKQCRACNHPRARPRPFLRPTTLRRALPPAPPRSCHHPYHAMPTLTATYTFCHRPPTSPISASFLLPSAPGFLSHPREHGVTASTIHNAHHRHPPTPPTLRTRTPSSSCRACFSLSLSVSTSVFLKRPIQSTQRVRPYLAVSTGTPARSLKENAIIRRTSTNELIVGASRYRQYRGVLYSTSPGATRL